MKAKTLSAIVSVAAALLALGGLLTGRSLTAAEHTALKESGKTVLDLYMNVQKGLAEDSLTGLNLKAKAIAAAVQKDASWDPKLAQQATVLSTVGNLATARAAFRALSDSLIIYLAQNNVAPGPYYQAYCSMAKASWLQTGRAVRNPYLGQSMSSCGEILPNFVPPTAAQAIAPPEDAHAGHAMPMGRPPATKQSRIPNCGPGRSCCP